MRCVVLATLVLALGCGPVQPASERAPVSGSASTTVGDDGAHPASDAPVHADDTMGPKYDFGGFGETFGSCPRMADVEPLRGAIELVVDASQATATQLVDHDGDPGTPEITRWAMIASALATWLPSFADGADLDLQLYPRPDAAAPPSTSACEAAVGPGLGTPPEALLAELPAVDATYMLGANPMSPALSQAQIRLQAVEGGRKRAIVVLADSAPNCTLGWDPPALFDLVDGGAIAWTQYAFDLGIETHVVAVALPQGQSGGTQGDPLAFHFEELQAIAIAGGNQLLTAGTTAELDVRLETVLGLTRSCRARVPVELAGAYLTVQIAGQEFYDLGFGTCPGGDGFVYVDPALQTMQLCGTACQLFLLEEQATLIEDCGFPE
jgi:hypothetical protein